MYQHRTSVRPFDRCRRSLRSLEGASPFNPCSRPSELLGTTERAPRGGDGGSPPSEPGGAQEGALTLDLSSPIWQTWTVVALLVGVHAVSAIWITSAGLSDAGSAWIGPRTDAALIASGARYAPAVAQGELWRLLTAPLLHGSLAHLAGNTLALLGLGRLGEPLVGRRWGLLLVVGAIAGGGLSHAAGVVRSVGASAAVQAGAWALCAGAARDRGALARRTWWALGPGLAVLLAVDAALGWWSQGVDLAAHAGGALVGIAGAATGLTRLRR